MIKLSIILFIALSVCGQDNNDVPCTKNTGGEGFCVPYFLCGYNNFTLLTDGSTILEHRRVTRELKRHNRVSREAYSLVRDSCKGKGLCCTLNPAIPDDSDDSKPTQSQILVNGPKCGSRNLDLNADVSKTEPKQSAYGEFPWTMGVLRLDKNKLNIYTCGATLIHPKVVVTAAQCINHNGVTLEPNEIIIRGGEWDTQTRKERFPHQDRRVEQIFIHKKFDPESAKNDIALLVLKTPMDITDGLNVICMPDSETQIDSSHCVVSGWGKLAYGSTNRFQTIMKKIEVPLVEKDECQKLLRKHTKLGSRFELHNSFICAGGKAEEDPCTGDGGSPLVCPIKGQDGRYQLTGIVSTGIDCGHANTPGLYTDVKLFKNWINQQLVNVAL